MAIKATQLRVGNVILRDGDLYRVESTRHITPGNWRGYVQTLLRNLRTGSGHDHRFRAEDILEKQVLEQIEMEYLYQDGQGYVFMNNETFDQVHLPEDLLSSVMPYLLPNTSVQVEFHAGRPVGIDLPISVRLRVEETEPGMKGATASSSPKPAKLETGLVVAVPQFVQVGDVIEVDTRTGGYLTRA